MIPSIDFLPFVNSLKKYKNDKRVGGITGNNFLKNKINFKILFFKVRSLLGLGSGGEHGEITIKILNLNEFKSSTNGNISSKMIMSESIGKKYLITCQITH